MMMAFWGDTVALEDRFRTGCEDGQARGGAGDSSSAGLKKDKTGDQTRDMMQQRTFHL
jgi:hypothetical protein